jgi:dTDP-glucose 4,6-dehydratase
VPRFITQAIDDEPLTVHGDGHASRDWLYVGDCAEAIERVIAAPLDGLTGEVVNVATGVDLTVGEIAQMVLAALGKPAGLIRHVEERPGQVDRHIGSTDKAARLLDWRAKTQFAEGLERTVAWYRENELWWRAILAREPRAYSSWAPGRHSSG